MPDAEVFHVDFQQGAVVGATEGGGQETRPIRYSEDPLINDAARAVSELYACYDVMEQGVTIENVRDVERRTEEALDKLDRSRQQEAIQLGTGRLF